jgi:hypothetical protein
MGERGERVGLDDTRAGVFQVTGTRPLEADCRHIYRYVLGFPS